jgi:hypothetical protein
MALARSFSGRLPQFWVVSFFFFWSIWPGPVPLPP